MSCLRGGTLRAEAVCSVDPVRPKVASFPLRQCCPWAIFCVLTIPKHPFWHPFHEDMSPDAPAGPICSQKSADVMPPRRSWAAGWSWPVVLKEKLPVSFSLYMWRNIRGALLFQYPIQPRRLLSSIANFTEGMWALVVDSGQDFCPPTPPRIFFFFPSVPWFLSCFSPWIKPCQKLALPWRFSVV